jgi:hypothetical protein
LAGSGLENLGIRGPGNSAPRIQSMKQQITI